MKKLYPGKRARAHVSSIVVGAASVAATLGNAQGFTAPQDPPCPTSQLAPFGINVNPEHCGISGCLVDFANYKWWTAYPYVGDYFNQYWYNGGLGTAFAPEHVQIQPDGMHIKVAQINLGGGVIWAGAEAVLMFTQEGKEANLGYGDYLVTAKIVSPSNKTWDTLDPNVAVGMFTYERLGPPPSFRGTGTPSNPNREIDLAEISRWGWNHVSPMVCPYKDSPKIDQWSPSTLCTGSAQFATQIFTKSPNSVFRYDISSLDTITLVLNWDSSGQKATFKQYAGDYSFATLSTATPNKTWTTPADLNKFIPNHATGNNGSCERFHLNFWLGNGIAGGSQPHPGPTDNNVWEVAIKRFEFQPAKLLKAKGPK
jgi:hypothetical protein